MRRRIRRWPLLVVWGMTLLMGAWVFLWPHPEAAFGIERRLVEKGYTPDERLTIRLTLEPKEGLALSVDPYRIDAIDYYGNPVYRLLVDHGYGGDDLAVLSNLDRATALNLIRYDVKQSPQRVLFDPYFMWTRFERYMALAEELPLTSGRTVVERINTDRDYAYYTQIKPALGEGLSVLVNKYYALSSDFEPQPLVQATSCGQPTLQQAAAIAYDALCAAVKAEGLDLGSSSAYRSYARQQELYDYYVAIDGQAAADTYSARPGHSEHQTGLAVDLNAGDGSIGLFVSTATYRWVSVNSWRYGFILRFPDDKTHITGYMFEPWHYRYVGIETATILHELDITYDEYAVWIHESRLVP